MKAVVAVLLCVVAVVAVAEGETGTDKKVQQARGEREIMQQVLACWMTFRDYLPKPHAVSLPIIKQCLQRLTQEDRRNRILAFMGTKTLTPKKLNEILTEYEISTLLASQQIGEASELDKTIMTYVSKYDEQTRQKMPQPQEVRERLDEEVAKRQSYFLGFIPANKYTAMILLIMGGMFLLFLCSCFRFRSRKDKRKQLEKKQLLNHNHKIDLKKIDKFASDPFFKKYDKLKRK